MAGYERLRLSVAGTSRLVSLDQPEDSPALHAIERHLRLVQSSSERQPIQKTGIELRDARARRSFRIILVEDQAHRIDEQLPFGSNRLSEAGKFVFGQRFRTLVGGRHREPDEFRCMTIGVVFPFAHASVPSRGRGYRVDA